MSSVRKRKTHQATKRSTARSIVNAVKFFSNLSSSDQHELGTDEETFRMQRQEDLQRQVDNFWGLDKDLKDRNREIALMSAEDEISKRVERDIKILAQHRLWDYEFHLEERMRSQREKDRRAFMRVDHLRLINSPVSVEDLLQTIWHLDVSQPVPILPQIASLSIATNSVANLQGPPDSAASLAQLEHMQESIATLGSMRMSLHLEGLQQTREIINQASGEFKQVLKDLRVGFNSQESVPPGFGEHSTDTFGSRKAQNKSKRAGLSASKFQQIEQQIEADRLKRQPFERLYNDAVEGHCVYHWDQEQLLHQTFLLLDTNNKGYLTREEVAQISYHPKVHELLQFTVLWSVIKKKEWSFFEEMLRRPTSSAAGGINNHHPHHHGHSHHSHGHNNNNSSSSSNNNGPAPMLKPISRAPSLRSSTLHQSSLSTSSIGSSPSTHSNSLRWQLQKEQQALDRYHHPPKDSLPYSLWFESALAISRESQVQVRHMRTIDEHVRASQQTLSAQVTKRFQSDYWSSDFCGPLRDFRVMRQLRVGDCVWVLHRKGVRWLPAVVEAIHYPYQQPFLPSSSASAAGGGGGGSSYHRNTINGYNNNNNNNNNNMGSPNTAMSSNHSVHSNNPGDSMSVMSMNSLTSAAEIPRRLHHQYCTYDVYYPLNQEELNKSRLATTSRQLLSLPSEQLVEDGMLPVRAFPIERSVCAYAFDLVDVDALGVVDLDVLIAAFQSPPMMNIVSTSLVLSSIFQGEVIVPHLPGMGASGSSGNGGSNGASGNATPLLRHGGGVHSRQASGIFIGNPSSASSSSPNQPIYVGRMKRQSQTMLLQQKREREKERIRQKMREKMPWWQRTESAPARPSFITVFCDTFTELPEEEERERGEGEEGGKSRAERREEKERRKRMNEPLGISVDDDETPRSDDSYDEEDDDDDDEGDFSRSSPSGGKKKKKMTPPPCISKTDFLEFCDAVLDIVRFDLPSLHHHVQQ